MSVSTKSLHQYSRAEVREKFRSGIRGIVDYWAMLPGKTDHERCEGVAFSILAAIDGCSAALPRFLLVPAPHPDDKRFCEQRGENWYPEPPAIAVCDISGRLHEHRSLTLSQP